MLAVLISKIARIDYPKEWYLLIFIALVSNNTYSVYNTAIEIPPLPFFTSLAFCSVGSLFFACFGLLFILMNSMTIVLSNGVLISYTNHILQNELSKLSFNTYLVFVQKSFSFLVFFEKHYQHAWFFVAYML